MGIDPLGFYETINALGYREGKRHNRMCQYGDKKSPVGVANPQMARTKCN